MQPSLSMVKLTLTALLQVFLPDCHVEVLIRISGRSTQGYAHLSPSSSDLEHSVTGYKVQWLLQRLRRMIRIRYCLIPSI
jgi:hypothetical protein